MDTSGGNLASVDRLGNQARCNAAIGATEGAPVPSGLNRGFGRGDLLPQVDRLRQVSVQRLTTRPGKARQAEQVFGMRQHGGILPADGNWNTRCKGAPTSTGSKPVAAGITRQTGTLRRQYSLDAGQAHFALLSAVAAPIDFIHTRINGCSHLLRAMLTQAEIGRAHV